MSANDHSILSEELGGPPPEEFSKLSADQLEDLAYVIRDVKRQQGAEFEKATEESIKALPLMLRGPVRAIVGSGK